MRRGEDTEERKGAWRVRIVGDEEGVYRDGVKVRVLPIYTQVPPAKL